MNRELIILERENGFYGGYEKTEDGYEQLFNVDDACLFMCVKFYTDKGYSIKCLDKTQEKSFMGDRPTIDDYLEEV